MGIYPAIRVEKGCTLPLGVLRFYLYVSHFTPRAWVRTTFTNVGPKVLVSYYCSSYGTQLLCWRLSKGETAKALPTKWEGCPSVLRAYQTPVFDKWPKANPRPCPHRKACGTGNSTTLHTLMAALGFKCRVSTTVLSCCQACYP